MSKVDPIVFEDIDFSVELKHKSPVHTKRKEFNFDLVETNEIFDEQPTFVVTDPTHYGFDSLKDIDLPS